MPRAKRKQPSREKLKPGAKPRAESAANERITVRFSPAEAAALRVAAGKQGLSLAAWLRARALETAAGKAA